ncbi:MAG: serine hydrolase domain-containing protein [Elainellaceae cyanobacterium]
MLGLLGLWSLAVIGVAIADVAWFACPVAPRGDVAAFEAYTVNRLNQAAGQQLGSATVALVQNGSLKATYGFSSPTPSGETVDPGHTLYQMASVSKLVTAWGVMRLVEEGAIALDDSVSSYLTRWRFPAGEFDAEAITVRQLLSHTAGLGDGFGYAGFLPGEPLQTLEDSLTLTRDPSAGDPRGVTVTQQPGKAWRYSGGGYTVLQLLVEEVTGQPFADYMAQAVLQPLGMTKASFDWEHIEADGRADNLATSFDTDLKPSPHRRYTAAAAASLYATAQDMAALVQAYSGRNPVLAPETLALMLSPQPGTADIWGLGHSLYVATENGGYVVGHDGGNLPALNHTVRVNPATGNGIVVMVSGSTMLASQVGDDWVFWETGKRTADALIREMLAHLPLTLAAIAIGAAVIVGMPIATQIFADAR